MTSRPDERPVPCCQLQSPPHGEFQIRGVVDSQILRSGQREYLSECAVFRFGIGDDRQTLQEVEIGGNMRGGDASVTFRP